MNIDPGIIPVTLVSVFTSMGIISFRNRIKKNWYPIRISLILCHLCDFNRIDDILFVIRMIPSLLLFIINGQFRNGRFGTGNLQSYFESQNRTTKKSIYQLVAIWNILIIIRIKVYLSLAKRTENLICNHRNSYIRYKKKYDNIKTTKQPNFQTLRTLWTLWTW